LFLLLLFSFFKLVKDLLLASPALLSSLFPPFSSFPRRVIPLSYLSLSWLKIFFSFLLSFFPFLSLSSLLFSSLYRRFFTFFFFCCRNSLVSTLSFSFLLPVFNWLVRRFMKRLYFFFLVSRFLFLVLCL
jgi:hypothetical protein